MKRKTKQVESFISDLHEFIIKSPQFRKKTSGRTEVQIQTEIRPLIIQYLESYYKKSGYKDYVGKANASFYWEGQEGKFDSERKPFFGARSYPDFIITAPYLLAIEYKQSPNGSIVKQGFGQSIIHTLSEDYHYVYYLFHDQSKDKRIEKSLVRDRESSMLKSLWKDFNILAKFV